MFPILAKKSPAASESFQHFKAGLLELEDEFLRFALL